MLINNFVSYMEKFQKPMKHWKKKKDDLGEELADIAIYLMGLSEMLGFDLEYEIINKVKKNEKRVYKQIDGVNVRIKD